VVAVLGVLEAAEPELMSVLLLLLVEPAAEPEAPIDVPLPVLVPVPEPAVVSVLGGVAGVDVLEADVLLLPGEVVLDGAVLDVDEDVEVSAGVVMVVSSFLLQALSDRAAIRARAAHCAIGDLIIRDSLSFVSKCID
jgi:hypothetical protein